jgi:hypothetical protein
VIKNLKGEMQMKKVALIIGTIMALAVTAWAADKAEPTKEQLIMQSQILNEKIGRLQAEYSLAVRDLEAVKTALQKVLAEEKAEKAKDKKGEKK